MKAYTFKEWQARGYHVLLGAKSFSKNKDGVALFTQNQVECDDHPDPWADVEAALDEDEYWNYDGYFDDIGDR